MPRGWRRKLYNSVTTTTFAELGLAEPLLRALNDAQYINPTPIQAQSIPVLLAGRDLLGLAETGTGKTAAFVLPLLNKLAEEGRAQPGAPRALILAPTRELAIQIGESIAVYGRHLRLSHTVIFGGVGQRPQVNAIARGVDILVATPGRLLDLIDQRHLRLGNVQTFVLDEADRMLDMGFVRDVRRILKLVPVKRHSLLFSATMPDDIAKLAAEFLKDPVRVEIARAGKTVDRIDQQVMFVSTSAKRDVLGHMLKDPELRRVIVFTRTKRGADRVSKAVEMMGVGVHAIHGNKSQGQRQSALDSFRKGFTRVLVATDIAARGIDIDEITHVINYELPNIPESYVHRIGRTARAGASGTAIALCAPDERDYLRDIERLIKRRLDVVAAPGGDGRSAPRFESHETDDEQVDARPETSGRPERHDRVERRPRQDRPTRSGDGARAHRRDGAPRQRDGAPRHRDGAPRGDRSEGGRPPRRDDDRRPAFAGERGDRPASAERQSDRERPNGRPHERQDSRQDGRRAERRSDDRRNGHGDGHGQRNGNSGGPRHANGRGPRQGDAPRDGRSDAPQPWRNWTRGSELSEARPERSAADRPVRDRAPRDEQRPDRQERHTGRPHQAKGPPKGPRGGNRERRGEAQGRGRAFR